jgi:hypothetical protein
MAVAIGKPVLLTLPSRAVASMHTDHHSHTDSACRQSMQQMDDDGARSGEDRGRNVMDALHQQVWQHVKLGLGWVVSCHYMCP